MFGVGCEMEQEKKQEKDCVTILGGVVILNIVCCAYFGSSGCFGSSCSVSRNENLLFVGIRFLAQAPEHNQTN